MNIKAILRLSDGSELEGYSFGYNGTVSGELSFDTTMIGYTEVITDPVYWGKLLILTYPIIGNYGMPDIELWESNTIQPSGIIVHNYTEKYSHWNAIESLGTAMKRNNVVGIYGIDTHQLAKKITSIPGLTGQIVPLKNIDKDIELLRAREYQKPLLVNHGLDKTILLIDIGANRTFINNIRDAGVNILKVSINEDFESLEYDGIVISNGTLETENISGIIQLIQKSIDHNTPIYGCGIGYNLIANALGIKPEKLQIPHRSLGQPVRLDGTNRCFITRMSHDKTIDPKKLPKGWKSYFSHLNSNCNCGFIHESGRFVATTFQFDNDETRFIFDHFISNL